MYFQFAVPIETKSELPWSTVAEMLKDKMRKLSSQRSLTEDNLNHLKHRILGKNKLTLVGCGTTVVPTKSDSDVIFCLHFLIKTLTCTLHLT